MLCIQVHAAGEEAVAAANLGVGDILHFAVGTEGTCLDNIQLTILVSCACCGISHFTHDDAVQLGLLTPPLVVGDGGEGLLGGVPAVGCQGEGAAAEFGVGVVHEAFVEEGYVEHCRVQDSAEEQTLDGVVCGLEDNACVVAVAVDCFNAFDVLVDTRCGDLVFAVGVALDLPGGLERIDVDGGAVIKDCLGVQTHLSGNLAVYFLRFEAEAVVGVELIFTLEGAAPDAGTGDDTHGFRDGNAGAVLGETVEVRADGVGAQVQGAALLELRGVLLVDFIERGFVCLVLGLGGRGATSAQYAGSSDGGCAAEQYAAAHDRVESGEGGDGLGAHDGLLVGVDCVDAVFAV